MRAIATNAKIAQTITKAGGDYLLAVKANQPTLRAETQSAFAAAAALDTFVDHDKGHGRIEKRTVDVIHEVDWLDGDRRFPGEFRLPGAATIIRVQSRAELADRSRFETRYYIASAKLTATQAAQAVRGHWGIENRLPLGARCRFRRRPPVPSAQRSRSQKHGYRQSLGNKSHPHRDRQKSIKLRRKLAGWDAEYLAQRLGALSR